MENIKAVCNWTRIGGCDWTQAIQTQLAEDEIIKPETDSLLRDEGALLLRRKMKVENNPDLGTCELELSLCKRFKISALTVICTVSKIEIFLGAQSEYYETEHGYLLDDEQNDNNEGPHSYRYDIEIEKSGITELTLKLLTSDDEICIFALLLQIAPNPNGVTTLLPNAINLENVQKMLESSNQKLTPSAEKCKKFLQMFGHAQSMQTGFPIQSTTSTTTNAPLKSTEISETDATLIELKSYIDDRMQKFETKILARLDSIEVQQSAKLDEILKALQTLK